jgi:ABC-type glycerol-3-phosphate transport system substrate-binding protein
MQRGRRHSPVQQPRPVSPRVYGLGALVLVLLAAGSWLVFMGPAHTREIVYCSGEDVSGSQHRSVADFNRSPKHGGSKARLVDDFGQAKTADGQRQEYLRRLPAGECDVVYLDVIYMPEFASKNLLRDMTSYVDGRGGTETFDAGMMKTVTYHGKRWGVPKQLDAGVLFFRADSGGPPTSWQQVLQEAVPRPGHPPGLRLQLDGYEGLTVVFLELAYAAGAKPIVSEDGKRANLDQDETFAALNFLRQAIKRGAVPHTVTTLGDEGSFDVFSRGRAKFLRSWPYIESRFRREAAAAEARGSNTAAARYVTASHHGVVSLPPWKPGGPTVGILGGHNLVIPRSARNPEGAMDLVDFLTSPDQVLEDARTASLAPALTELSNDERVGDNPALGAVQDDVLELRPMIPQYHLVSREIYTTLRRVLRTDRSPQGLREELHELNRRVQDLL